MFRWIALSVFVASLAISAWHRAQARRATGTIPRGAEPPLLIAGRLLVALPLFGGVITYLLEPEWMRWAALPLPAALRWAGAALGLVVVPAVDWVLRTLGANVSETVLTKAEHRLVTTGPYRWVRHPLYTVGVALFGSVGLMAANGFILAWTVLALIAVRLVVIPREEAELERAFGGEYRRYRERTGALLPRLPGYR